MPNPTAITIRGTADGGRALAVGAPAYPPMVAAMARTIASGQWAKPPRAKARTKMAERAKHSEFFKTVHLVNVAHAPHGKQSKQDNAQTPIEIVPIDGHHDQSDCAIGRDCARYLMPMTAKARQRQKSKSLPVTKTA